MSLVSLPSKVLCKDLNWNLLSNHCGLSKHRAGHLNSAKDTEHQSVPLGVFPINMPEQR